MPNFPKKNYGINTKFLKFAAKTAAGIIFILALNLTIFIPVPAQAAQNQSFKSGFFSFIKGLVAKSETTIPKSRPEAESSNNSQNIAVLRAALNFDPLIGQGGGEINVIEENVLMPVLGPGASFVENAVQNQSHQISVYVVREGDTLSGIAKLFNVSVNTIFWSNNIKRKDHIVPGQVLVILPVSGVKYEIQKGDTIAKIAKKFKGDPDEIIAFNGLSDGNNLKVGEEIIIPYGELPYVPKHSSSRVVIRGAGGPDYSGYYLRPINGGRKSQGLHGFNAVDLATYCGEPIYASASGDVIAAKDYGWNGGYGEYVVIGHPNNTQTLYAHLSSVIISAGWHVVQGQVIGYVGSTGRSSGCHIHFEVRGAKNPF